MSELGHGFMFCVVGLLQGEVCVWAPRVPARSLAPGPRRGRHSHALCFLVLREIYVDWAIYTVRRFGVL